MINHIVLIKLTAVERRDDCMKLLRGLDQLDSCESVVVAPELGQLSNRWDIAVVIQHKDAGQLDAFRIDAKHAKIGAEVAPYIAKTAVVDFESDRLTILD